MKSTDIQTLLSTFDHEDRQAWVDRIHNSITPEQRVLDDRLGVAITAERPDHPAYAKFNHQWKIGQSFRYDVETDTKLLNKQILTSLEGGVEHLVISVNNNLDIATSEILFNGVIPDYIETTFLIQTKDVTIVLPSSWSTHHYQVVNLESRSHYLSFDADNSAVENIVAILHTILKSIDQPSQTYYISIPINDQYLAEISKLRALHHSFNLINQACNWQHRLRIIATYGSVDPSDLDYQKIGNTARATTAILGGATTVLPFGMDVMNSEEVRLGVNQLHLLRLESYLDKVADPLRGSHLIEHYTDAIAKAVWTKLNEAQ